MYWIASQEQVPEESQARHSQDKPNPKVYVSSWVRVTGLSPGTAHTHTHLANIFE